MRAPPKRRPGTFTRRDFLAGAAGAAAAASLPGGLAAAQAPPARARPNILLIETDDHWPRALGCMGDPVIQTPHVDALAARGVRFARNVCQGTECIPSRVSLLTGSYPHNNGVHSNHGQRVEPTQWTFPAALQRSGYHCVLVGKHHLQPRAQQPGERTDPAGGPELVRFGFDEVRAVNGKVWAARGWADDAYRSYLREKGLLKRLQDDYRENRSDPLAYLGPSPLEPDDTHDAFIARLATQWIDAYRGSRPFFLWLNFVSPHVPCDAPLPFATQYDPADMPPPIPARAAGWPTGLRDGLARYRRVATPDFVARFRAAYYGMVSFVDFQIGKVLEALARRGLREDTLVVFCGDQGEMAGDHGLFGKGVFFRSAIESPLVVSWPRRFGEGSQVKRPVELQDLVPTFLELAGAPEVEREHCTGQSLMPLLTGEGAYERDAAFAEKFAWKMITTADHKYVYHPSPAARLLFDLREDPRELRNLARRPEGDALGAELREQVLAWLARTWRQPNSKPLGPVPAAG